MNDNKTRWAVAYLGKDGLLPDRFLCTKTGSRMATLDEATLFRSPKSAEKAAAGWPLSMSHYHWPARVVKVRTDARRVCE